MSQKGINNPPKFKVALNIKNDAEKWKIMQN